MRINLNGRELEIGSPGIVPKEPGRIYHEDIVRWAGLDPAKAHRVMFNWRTPEPYCAGGYLKQGEYVDLVDNNLWFNVKAPRG